MSAIPRGTVQILIAEDDEDDYLLAKDAFRECCPYARLSWVRDGEELMDFLLRRGKYENGKDAPRPSMILLDLNMPRKDGREVLKEIKSHPKFHSIPVIVLTTSDSEEDIRYTYDLGVNSYIRKPIGFSQFLEMMKVFEKYWFDIARLPSSP